jgi:hypothetical protein
MMTHQVASAAPIAARNAASLFSEKYSSIVLSLKKELQKAELIFIAYLLKIVKYCVVSTGVILDKGGCSFWNWRIEMTVFRNELDRLIQRYLWWDFSRHQPDSTLLGMEGDDQIDVLAPMPELQFRSGPFFRLRLGNQPYETLLRRGHYANTDSLFSDPAVVDWANQLLGAQPERQRLIRLDSLRRRLNGEQILEELLEAGRKPVTAVELVALGAQWHHPKIPAVVLALGAFGNNDLYRFGVPTYIEQGRDSHVWRELYIFDSDMEFVEEETLIATFAA